MNQNLIITQYKFDVSTAITIIVNTLDDIKTFATPEERETRGYRDMISAFVTAREALFNLQRNIKAYESNHSFVRGGSNTEKSSP